MVSIPELLAQVGELTTERNAIDAQLTVLRAQLEKELRALQLKGEVVGGGIKAGLSYPKPTVKIIDRQGLLGWVKERYPTEIQVRDIPAEQVTEIRPAFCADLLDRLAKPGGLEARLAHELSDYLKVEPREPYLRVTELGAALSETE